MSERYYRANKKGREVVEEYFRQWKNSIKGAKKLAKELGGTDALWTWNNSQQTFSGIVFEQPPDRKLWKPIKNYSGGWEPKATKQGKAIRAKMKALQKYDYQTMRDVFGLPSVFEILEDRTLFRGLFGVSVGKDRNVYLSLSENEKREPINATRVSDLTYEKHNGKDK